jgi:multiple sugar transport system permease protein
MAHVLPPAEQSIAPLKRGLRLRPRHRTERANNDRSLLSPLDLKRPVVRFGYWLTFALLLFAAVVAITPMYWLFTDGLKSSMEINALPPSWVPQHPDWHGLTNNNFRASWDLLDLGHYLNNTLILVAGSLIFQVLVSVTAAFSLAKLRPAFGNIWLGFFFATLLVPMVTYLIPQYLNVSSLPVVGWNIGSGNWIFLGVLLPEAANAFNLYILKSFFDSIPDEIIAAARIDGANALDLMTRIVMPMSRAALAVVAILTLMASWKDFLWPYVVMAGDQDHQPLMVFLFYQWQNRSLGVPENVLFASFGLVSIPPILLFLVFQRQIIRGISLTGLTG